MLLPATRGLSIWIVLAPWSRVREQARGAMVGISTKICGRAKIQNLHSHLLHPTQNQGRPHAPTIRNRHYPLQIQIINMSKVNTAPIKWAQRSDSLYVTIALAGKWCSHNMIIAHFRWYRLRSLSNSCRIG